MESIAYSNAIATVRSTADCALYLTTCLMGSLNQMLAIMKNPRVISFFLTNNALVYLKYGDHDAFWKEVKYEIKHMRREIRTLSESVEDWQWEIFDDWFVKRSPRLDDLDGFCSKVYMQYWEDLNFIQSRDILAMDMERTWQQLCNLARASRETCAGTPNMLVWLQRLGNRMRRAREGCSLVKSPQDAARGKFYVVSLDDINKRPDDTLRDVYNGFQNKWGVSAITYHTLFNLYTLLMLTTTGYLF